MRDAKGFAFITGASSGIGAVYADRLAALVDTALAALDHGEMVTVPALHDLSAWEQFEEGEVASSRR